MRIIAGPNGSGKSTFIASDQLQALIKGLVYLNADDLAKQLSLTYSPLAPRYANLAAADIVDGQVEACIQNDIGFAVETVLSSKKYKNSVRAARRAGFKIGLIFIYTAPPTLNVERVRQRASVGGHSVDSTTVIARWYKSVSNFAWFANRADYLLLADNTEDVPRLNLIKEEGGAWLHQDPVHDTHVQAAINAAQKAQARFQAIKAIRQANSISKKKDIPAAPGLSRPGSRKK